MAEDARLSLTNVTRSFPSGDGDLVILDDANFSASSGELVALVAPSGAGKSTFLQICGLLDRPQAGRVAVDGQDTAALDDGTLSALRGRSVGFVYQFHHLLPEFDALENIMMPQLIAGLDRKTARDRAQELLNYLKLGSRATHRPAELSGGEQQRVAIARAMANVPQVLLADEPTGNLDPETSEHVFSMLVGLVRAAGVAAVIATHNLELAKRADKIVTLDNGKLVDFQLP